jgi:multimeric flavodoxin WrbA
MNAVILNGGPGNRQGETCLMIKSAAARELEARGWAVKAFDLDSMSIKPCLGCFACWVKHPGTCALKDDEEQVLRAMAAEDLAVWITPVTFGGFSPALKKALDRSIPRVLPFFIRVGGEVHHPQRYPRARKLLVIGTLAGPDVEAGRIFRDLARRNGLNLQTDKTEAGIIDAGAAEAEVKALVRGLIRAAGIA